MSWYLIETTNRQEKLAAAQIERVISRDGLEQRIRELLVPGRSDPRRKGATTPTHEQPAFPGYVMVEMDMDEDLWQTVSRLPAVKRFVTDEDENRGIEWPAPLSEQDILELTGADIQYLDLKGLEIGDTVRITEGAFEDIVGQITDTDHNTGRVTVAVNAFGRMTPVQLMAEQTIKV